jgi:hypothetical protein
MNGPTIHGEYGERDDSEDTGIHPCESDSNRQDFPPSEPNLKPDLDAAQRHLTLLDESTSVFLFQTFDDDKARRDGRLTRVLYGTLEEHAAELTRLNQQGGGIFLTVQQTTGCSRKKESVIKLRALFRENDGLGGNPLPLEPHVVIETSPGKHHEYLLVQDAPLGGRIWEAVQGRLVKDYGSDPNAKDRSRVLRLAGFFHRKDPASPHRVRIVRESGGLPYPWAQVVAALPPVSEPWSAGDQPEHSAHHPQLPQGRGALRYLNPDCEYQRWLEIGMALHDATEGSAAGLDLWDCWSRGDFAGGGAACGRYPGAEELTRKWASLGGRDRSAQPITLASVFAWAREAGWDGTVTGADCGVPEDLPFIVDLGALVPNARVRSKIEQGPLADREIILVDLLTRRIDRTYLLSLLLDQRHAIAAPSRDEAEAALEQAQAEFDRPVRAALAFFDDATQKAKANRGFALTDEALEHLAVLQERNVPEFHRIRGKLQHAGTPLRPVDSALQNRRETKAQIKYATGERRPTRPASWPYEATRSGLIWHKETDCGSVKVELSNFHATIARQVIHDDGTEANAMFQITGSLMPSGKPLPMASVPLSQFQAMTWVTSNWGNDAIVAAGSAIRDHLRCAIQRVSGEVPTTVVYGHVGWRNIDGMWRYLHAGGALGADDHRADIRVDVDTGAMQHYRLPVTEASPEEISAAIRESLALLAIAPQRPEIGFLALAAIYRAPTYTASQIDLSLFVVGKTGAMKSELTALLQAHFGDFDARRLPGSWQDTATDLEMKASHAMDTIFVIDDFKPVGGKGDIEKLHAKADRVLRGVGNQSGRGRRKADLSARPSYYPRCFVVSSGEDLPKGESLRGRMVIVDVRKGDIDPRQLTRLQHAARQGQLVQCMAGFLRWLASRMEKLQERIPREIARFRERDDLPFAHARAADNLANLMIGLKLFLSFALDHQAIDHSAHDHYLLEGEHYLTQLMHAQTQYIRDADEVDRVLALLRTAFNSGHAHLCDATSSDGPPDDSPSFWGWRNVPISSRFGGSDSRWEPQGNRIGWIKNDELLLDPEATFATVQTLASTQGDAIAITSQTLWKRLKERGVLRVTGGSASNDKTKKSDSRNTVQRKAGKKTHRVLLMDAVWLDESRNTRSTRSAEEEIAPREEEIYSVA